MEEKTGFIYIWYDRKRKMYYIGCHVGDENDGYICSSNRMRDAYRRRPHDFKRRIIKRNISRTMLLSEEHKWLSLIPDDELGIKYYNHSKQHFGHWSNTDKAQQISEKLKGRTHTEETRKKLSLAHKGKTRVFTEEHKKKLSESLKGKTLSDDHKKKLSEAKKGKSIKPETIEKIIESRKWYSHSELTKRKIGDAHRGKIVTKETREKSSDSHKSQVPWNKGVKGYKILKSIKVEK